MTTTGAVHGADTADLQRRVEALLEALDVAGSRVPGAVAARVRRTAAQVRERLELGVDQTVVALAGGTGSGKSSLFNAIAGLEFAEVGVKRPTTSRVTACVWGADGEPLLDWLGVGPDDRIQRESELDADDQAPLRGLVLLDLPDHDSVSPEHRQVVDRVVPLADLLVWVVDPQKYADDALHTGYLQRLVGHQASMVVVLNQLDTLAPEVRGELADDLRRLLVEDGLPGVGVLRASARTGEGIDTVRAELAGVVGQRSSAALRAGTEVDDAARELGGRLGAAEPAPARLAVTPVVDALTDAVGLPAVSDAVGAV
ncbi:MAG: 50S ribosome-binding GTPase, partial [Cellulomonas sp.]|nr:50S ribosome-binding GTPase [Cellulomonas sp.]